MTKKKKDTGAGKFAIGAAIGAAVGVVAGILTAPKSGKETRADAKKKAVEAKDYAVQKSVETKEYMNKKSCEAKKKASGLFKKAADANEKTAKKIDEE